MLMVIHYFAVGLKELQNIQSSSFHIYQASASLSPDSAHYPQPKVPSNHSQRKIQFTLTQPATEASAAPFHSLQDSSTEAAQVSAHREP